MKAVRVSLTKLSSELTLKTPNVTLAMVQRLVPLYYFLLFKTAKYIKVNLRPSWTPCHCQILQYYLDHIVNML